MKNFKVYSTKKTTAKTNFGREIKFLVAHLTDCRNKWKCLLIFPNNENCFLKNSPQNNRQIQKNIILYKQNKGNVVGFGGKEIIDFNHPLMWGFQK